MAEPSISAIRLLGGNGEIVLGKEYAGHSVSVETLEPGVWIVKVGAFVPENERWLFEPEVQAKLDAALARAQTEPYRETDLDELEERILRGSRPDSTGSQ